jgi:hypothetical protein
LMPTSQTWTTPVENTYTWAIVPKNWPTVIANLWCSVNQKERES